MVAVAQMTEGWGLHYVMWYVWSDIFEVHKNDSVTKRIEAACSFEMLENTLHYVG